MRTIRREKTFGPGRAVPLDRNAKVRVQVYARAWTARHRHGRQHRGPLTRAFMDVLAALLWQFHNARTGVCYPSYETIAERAGCARSTVAAAIKALEWAGLLSWQNRITRIRERCRDLFGNDCWRWQIIRTSNAYTFIDPMTRLAPPSDQEKLLDLGSRANFGLTEKSSPLEHALMRLGDALKGKSAWLT